MDAEVPRPWDRLRKTIASIRHREDGQTFSEYALLLAATAILLIVGMLFLAGKIDTLFRETGSKPSILKPPKSVQCDPNYTGACVPPYPPDLDCADLGALGLPLPVSVVGGDPHALDPDGDGLGC